MPPLQPDIPGSGKPSDHCVPFAKTYLDRRIPKQKTYTIKSTRTFPESGIREFGSWLQSEKFTAVIEAITTTEKVDVFERVIANKIDEIFPLKDVKIYKGDKEFMTKHLRQLRRQKSREYRKNKKSDKFLKLQNEFIRTKKENTKEYIEKIEDLKNCNLAQFYKKIKEVGSRLGEHEESTFTLLKHNEEKLDAQHAAEEIAKHFSQISQEFTPINTELFPSRVKEKIMKHDVFKTAPILEEYEVYNKLKNKKIKNSVVPGDIPPKLKREFLPEFSFPVTNIFNSITKTGDYPRQWVTEYVTPIPKVIPPESEDDLRNISLTADLSKNYEQLLAQWLMPYIQKRIDPGQFGGLHGHSTNHYLISLFNFILKNTDTSTYPKAVIVALIDFSKAFKRIDHNKVIIWLSDWGVPGWILRILVSYLSKRSMILKYKGKQSMKYLMPGGSPQGTLLGVLLYLVYVNDIGIDLPSAQPSEPGVVDLPSCAFPPPAAISETEARLKFVDDLTVGECVRLDKKLQQNKNALVLPPDQSVLQERLNDIHQSTSTHDMKINLSKSKSMIFNFSRNYQFEHTLSLEGFYLNPAKETKLLVLTITNDYR